MVHRIGSHFALALGMLACVPTTARAEAQGAVPRRTETAPAPVESTPSSAPAAPVVASDRPTGKGAAKPKPIRSGVVFALSADVALGSASGYPNDAKLLNDRNFYGRTPPLLGGGLTFAFSGALTEYLNVGFFFSSSSFKNDAWSVTSGGGGMRIDAYPLTYASKPWLRHLAVYGLVGVGAVNVKYEQPGQSFADLDGTQSFLGLGSFYEFRWGALGLGPDARFDAVVSRTASRVAFVTGLRLSFYPSKLF